MQYCRKCLNPDTRPSSMFHDGVCNPCFFYNDKTISNDLDFDTKRRFEKHILAQANARSLFEVKFALGVSGGKDSLRQALFCREILGIEPTLISVGYSPSQVTAKGVANLANLYQHNFEILTGYPSVPTAKALAKFCFFEYGNLKIASEVALFAGAARLARFAGSDIILWGENPAISVGDSGSIGTNEFDGSSITQINTLKQVSQLPDELVAQNELFYDLVEAVSAIADRIVYMGTVIPFWSQMYNGMYSFLNGFQKRTSPADYLSISAVDEDFVIINQYIKYLKFGFSRTSDIANELIRMGEITRDKGIELAEKFDGYVPVEEIGRFANFIGEDNDKVWRHVLTFADTSLFDVSSQFPSPKFKVGEGLV